VNFLLEPKDVQANYSAFVVLDARFRLTAPAEAESAYLAEHLPGAAFLSLDRDLSGVKTGVNGRHPFPKRASLAALFSKLGISSDQPVVVYDDADQAGAARAWMLLRWMGHENVSVLSGGLAAWKKAGFPLEGGVAPLRAPANFPDRPSLITLLSKEELASEALFDARAPERFRGDVEPLDKLAGHIPGAKNLFYKTLLDSEGRFLPEAELRARMPKGPATFYCGSGVTASVLLLAAESLRLSASIYPGSWSEWSSQENPPVAKGDG
jgi:thiosulfate/3-mercaptopyruvate sulfurtransferase